MSSPPAHARAFWEDADRLLLPTSPVEREVVTRGRGAWLTTTSGQELLDLGSGQVCATFGHGNPRITGALARQLERLIHSGSRFLPDNIVEAARAVASITPPELTRVAFPSTGTEANELALRLAKLCTGRTGVAAMRGGYLGTSLMLRSLSEAFIDEPSAYPKTPGCVQFDLSGLPAQEVHDAVSAQLAADRHQLAAIIVEPIQGAHGIQTLPEGTLAVLREVCDAWGALLVLDEAQTGMGRTGRWFAFEHEGIVPDVLVFSKCAGGGYPVSCVVVTEPVAERVMRGGWFYLSSHLADPLALAAVGATIHAARECEAPARAERLGRSLRAELEARCTTSALLSHVTGTGLLLGLHCADLGPDAPAPRVSRRLFQIGLRHRVVLGYGDWAGHLLLAPPLTLTEGELRFALDALDAAIAQVEAEWRSGATFPAWESPPPTTQRFLGGLAAFRRYVNRCDREP